MYSRVILFVNRSGHVLILWTGRYTFDLWCSKRKCLCSCEMSFRKNFKSGSEFTKCFLELFED